MHAMPKRESRPSQGKKYPSQDGRKYVQIPADLWHVLDDMAKADDRSVAYVVRKILRECLERDGKLPKKHST